MNAPAARAATLADAPAIAALFAECFEDPWSADMVAQSLAHAAEGIVVTAADGSLAGGVLVQAAGGEAEILQVAVAPSSRRGGLGRRLVRLALDLALALGASDVFLEVRPHNEAAIALYRSEGFELVGRRRAYYSNGEDALLWRRRLGAPAGRAGGPA